MLNIFLHFLQNRVFTSAIETRESNSDVARYSMAAFRGRRSSTSVVVFDAISSIPVQKSILLSIAFFAAAVASSHFLSSLPQISLEKKLSLKIILRFYLRAAKARGP